MEFSELLIFALLIALSFVHLVITLAAYSHRKDKSFFGGANILGGWWLLFPYGSDGVHLEAKKLVLWGRLVFIGIILCAVALSCLD
jgi:hypothetical protein